jgi:hypothetical protein
MKMITTLEHSKGICPRNCLKEELMEPVGNSSWMCGKDLEEEIRFVLDVLSASVKFSRKPATSEGLVRSIWTIRGTEGTAAKNS